MEIGESFFGKNHGKLAHLWNLSPKIIYGTQKRHTNFPCGILSANNSIKSVNDEWRNVWGALWDTKCSLMCHFIATMNPDILFWQEVEGTHFQLRSLVCSCYKWEYQYTTLLSFWVTSKVLHHVGGASCDVGCMVYGWPLVVLWWDIPHVKCEKDFRKKNVYHIGEIVCLAKKGNNKSYDSSIEEGSKRGRGGGPWNSSKNVPLSLAYYFNYQHEFRTNFWGTMHYMQNTPIFLFMHLMNYYVLIY